MNNKIFIDVLRNKPSKKTPIWIMRQAGRYLPEYRILREKAGSFLNLCYSPKDACEVTMQPIKRFGFDAAIIFSDILIVPHSLGIKLEFKKGDGPILEKITNENELKKLNISKNNQCFDKIWETVSRVKAELPKDKALIGFAGAPWTVATYVLEGRGKTGFPNAIRLAKENPEFVQSLINIIIEQTINYLIGQIEAGAEVIQIFDTWAGVLEKKEYERFVEFPSLQIISCLRELYPDILFIGFPKGIKGSYKSYIKAVKPDGFSIDSSVSMEEAKDLQNFVTIQGNLDPELLLTDKAKIKDAAENILNNLAGKNFIFNLGHGVLPETPVENVEFLVNLVQNYEKR